MKKTLILLAACGMLCCCTACGSNNNRNISTEVSLPDALPNPDAARALIDSGVEVRFAGDYVSTLNGKFVTSKIENETDAFNAIAEVAELYGIKDAAQELKFDETVTGRVSTVYYFQQYYEGLRVAGSRIGLYVDPETLAVKYMNSGYIPDLTVSTEASVAADAAAETVKSAYSVTLSGDPELVIFTNDKGSSLAWAVATASEEPAVVYVDAKTGSELYAEKPIG